jgi:hypothetical protein
VKDARTGINFEHSSSQQLLNWAGCLKCRSNGAEIVVARLTEKDLSWLMRLVDAEIYRICNESALSEPTAFDHAWLNGMHIKWDGDSRKA